MRITKTYIRKNFEFLKIELEFPKQSYNIVELRCTYFKEKMYQIHFYMWLDGYEQTIKENIRNKKLANNLCLAIKENDMMKIVVLERGL